MKLYDRCAAQAHRGRDSEQRAEVIELQGGAMNKGRSHFLLLIYVFLIVGIGGCQRETPAEKTGTQNNQPTRAVEQTAQQAADSVKTPIATEPVTHESLRRTDSFGCSQKSSDFHASMT